MSLTTIALEPGLARDLRAARPRGVPLGAIVAFLMERLPPEEIRFQLEARQDVAREAARERAAALAGAPATRRSPGEQRALAAVAAERFAERLATGTVVEQRPRRYVVGNLAGGEARVRVRRRPR
ncbi:MAG TPA: hypothetical protein VM889_00075 [Candidatus Thermoplasmatota archaeon]|nr:hypothetical protein [Candidatus Thermoplasmatota archaeon]